MKIFDYIRERFRKKRIENSKVQCHLCKGLFSKDFCYQMEIDRNVPFFVCEDCSEMEGKCTWEVTPQ